MYYQYCKPTKDNVINIVFMDEQGKKINILANRNEMLFSLFQKYISLTGKYDDIYFKYSGEQLNPNKTLKEYDLASGSIIKVADTNNVIGRGGYALNFTDLSKQNYEEITFTNDAPDYRNTNQGINIFGDCKTEGCYAFNQEVIVPLYGIGKFDLINERQNLKCPACKGLIEPKTVGFYLCEYKIKGKNFENGNIKPFEFFGKALNTQSLQYYDPIKNGNTIVLELIIEIINYF
jgi:hypothetical protein